MRNIGYFSRRRNLDIFISMESSNRGEATAGSGFVNKLTNEKLYGFEVYGLSEITDRFRVSIFSLTSFKRFT